MGDDRQDKHLSRLSALADMARLNVPCDVLTHAWPPVVFDYNGACGIEAPVTDVIVAGVYGFDATVSIEYPLVHALRVSLPENVLV